MRSAVDTYGSTSTKSLLIISLNKTSRKIPNILSLKASDILERHNDKGYVACVLSVFEVWITTFNDIFI